MIRGGYSMHILTPKYRKNKQINMDLPIHKVKRNTKVQVCTLLHHIGVPSSSVSITSGPDGRT